MEEHAEQICRVVYYCDGLGEQICELYQCHSLPEHATAKGGPGGHALDVVHRNVHALLDEDQGGLDEGRKCCCDCDGRVLTTAQSS